MSSNVCVVYVLSEQVGFKLDEDLADLTSEAQVLSEQVGFKLFKIGEK